MDLSGVIEINESKTGTFVCEKHGEYTGEMCRYLWMGEPREVPPECPACLQEIEEQKRLEAERAEKERVIRRWRSMNIDDKYFDSTFDNFKAYNDDLKRHLETCRAFAGKPDGKLVMIGKNGNGKTHLAVSVLKKLGGVIYTAADIAINIRSTYNGGESSEKEIFDKLCSVPLLVIDEVEKIKQSEWKNYWMSHVIGKRYNRLLPLIIIANCHLQKDCAERNQPCPDCLEHHIENDVISRITEDGFIMKFNSGDYRKKIRQAKFGKNSGE